MKSATHYSSIKYILILLSVLFVQCSATRTSELYQTYDKVNYVYWSESRKLIWEDFQGKQNDSQNNNISQIRLYNPATIERATYLSNPELTVICIFDKKNSWVKKSAANDSLLLYHQVMFDIYELYNRKLKKQFNETEFSLNDYIEEFKSLTGKNNSDLEQQIEQYKIDSDHGNNYAGIKSWEMKVNRELDELKSFKTNDY